MQSALSISTDAGGCLYHAVSNEGLEHLCLGSLGGFWNQSLADTEGLYFSMAKAGSLREQANGGDSDRRGKDRGIRISSMEVSGFHQIVEWEPVEEL